MAAETHVKTYRVAVPGDEAAILNVFAEVAPEVPTAVRPQTEGIIKELVATGDSWVAIDADDKIIGYPTIRSPHMAMSSFYKLSSSFNRELRSMCFLKSNVQKAR